MSLKPGPPPAHKKQEVPKKETETPTPTQDVKEPCNKDLKVLRRCKVILTAGDGDTDKDGNVDGRRAETDKTPSQTKDKDTKTSKKSKKARVLTKPPEEELPELPPECYEEELKDAKKAGDIMVNKMTPQWFQKIRITPGKLKRLCFSESLLMVDEVGNVSGKMYTSVKPSKFGGTECICVHSGSYGKPDPGMECGTTITGFISFDMKPLQEFVHEWALCDGKLTERKTFIMTEENSIRIQISFYKDGELAEEKVSNLSRMEQRLVTEGGNILLLRLLMIEKRALGDMELKTVTFTGAVVKNKYAALANGWENVKGEEIRTWSIRRTVSFDFGDRIWDCMLNQFGRLILRCQPENMHALIPLWFEPVKEIVGKDGKVDTPPSYPPYIWACDAELYSKYLLKRDELAADNRSYLLDNPDLRALLSDFIQSVLLKKPANIIPFTANYFESFLKFRPGSETGSQGSSSSSENGYDMGEYDGEWAGEALDSYRFYSTRPTRSLDGLEKVSSEDLANFMDELMGETTGLNSLTLDEDGQDVTPNPTEEQVSSIQNE